MKIPKTVRIGGVEYSVEFINNLNDGVRVLNGQVEYAQSKIRIKSDDEYQHQCVTLVHEILHAIAAQRCMELGDNEEKIIDGFAYGVYQILQDNGAKLIDAKK